MTLRARTAFPPCSEVDSTRENRGLARGGDKAERVIARGKSTVNRAEGGGGVREIGRYKRTDKRERETVENSGSLKKRRVGAGKEKRTDEETER